MEPRGASDKVRTEPRAGTGRSSIAAGSGITGGGRAETEEGLLLVEEEVVVVGGARGGGSTCAEAGLLGTGLLKNVYSV